MAAGIAERPDELYALTVDDMVDAIGRCSNVA